jgi:UDP-glucose 4-epimerase
VNDLAHAHSLSLDYLLETDKPEISLNLGSSEGSSVLEVTHHKIPSVVSSRRPGDPPHLIASNEKAKSKLEDIIKTSWSFVDQYQMMK